MLEIIFSNNLLISFDNYMNRHKSVKCIPVNRENTYTSSHSLFIEIYFASLITFLVHADKNIYFATLLFLRGFVFLFSLRNTNSAYVSCVCVCFRNEPIRRVFLMLAQPARNNSGQIKL